MAEFNVTQELVLLLRGFFATPVISCLGRLGVLEGISSGSVFTTGNFPDVKNVNLLADCFRYFARLGLLEETGNDAYKASELGQQIFSRASSFYVPHSYHEYMNNFYELLLDPSFVSKQSVSRLENVIGSGMTHQRYFPPAISFLKRRVNFDVLADIGCGDGHFLVSALKEITVKKAVGIDISNVAIDETRKNLKNSCPGLEISMICSDAFDVENWGRELSHLAATDRIAITMWFLMHEISKNSPERIISYLSRIHDMFPSAPLVIGELVRHNAMVLADHRTTSIMPEYLFFHAFSGQGILKWEELQKILQNIPYILKTERLFDEITDDKNNVVPSAIVWCLLPK